MTDPNSDGRTTTQPRPNISTEPHKHGDNAPPSDTQPRPNRSTEHQESGDARRPSDVLDRGQDKDERTDRKTSLTRND
jgi:hypothetical protein